MRDLRVVWLLQLILLSQIYDSSQSDVHRNAKEKRNVDAGGTSTQAYPECCSRTYGECCNGTVRTDGRAEDQPTGLVEVPAAARNAPEIDDTHVSKYGTCNQSLSLDEFTTLHPSEAGSSSPLSSSVTSSDNKTLKISSDKVHNGGRKGPMSGAKNQGGSALPVPILIPFPIIPAQGQGSAQNPQNGQNGNGQNAQNGNSQGAQNGGQSKKKKSKKLNDGRKADAVTTWNKHRNKVVNKHLLQLTNRQENAIADLKGLNDSIGRLKRQSVEIDSDSLTDEERTLREKWLHPDEKDLIPGAESNNFYPSVNAFMREVIPILRKSKWELLNQNSDDMESLRQTREIEDVHHQMTE